MTTRWQSSDLAGRTGIKAVNGIAHAMRQPKPSKLGNKRTQVDGIKFASKLEARRYQALTLMRKAGSVRWFIRQVPFHLDGGTIYRCDFLVVWADGSIGIEDCKGWANDVYPVKKREVEHKYGIEITEIRS